MAPDKTTHFATSAGYGLVIGTVTYKFADDAGPAKRIALSSSIALIPGLVVEIRDEYQSGIGLAGETFLPTVSAQ